MARIIAQLMYVQRADILLAVVCTLTTPPNFIWPRKFASVWLGEMKSGAVVGVYGTIKITQIDTFPRPLPGQFTYQADLTMMAGGTLVKHEVCRVTDVVRTGQVYIAPSFRC
jgi:hypothetical protein